MRAPALLLALAALASAASAEGAAELGFSEAEAEAAFSRKADDGMEAGFGAGGGISEAEKGGLEEQRLDLGGSFATLGAWTVLEGAKPEDEPFSNLTQAFLWADSRLEGDARLLAKGKFLYDPAQAAPGAAVQPAASLEELKLSFSWEKRLFVTAGRQKVKHGSARFFNPSDFLNAQPRDFFLAVDERPGVDMLRLHLPVEKANFYLGALSASAPRAADPGAWARAELGYAGYGALGGGEAAAALLVRRDQPTRGSLDLSQELGPFDAYFEGAGAPKAAGEGWEGAYATGLSWEIQYSETAINTLTLQAEWFQAGASLELAGLLAYLPQPLNVRELALFAYGLYDPLGRGALARVDATWQVNRQVGARLWGSRALGEAGGLFRSGGRMGDLGVRLDAAF